ncbi:DUF6142 family protein [Lachnoclostridium sp. Marseille-P6806]|uniref:DUF6142 family protein n=1 Tax=Lachnoclostridium sp. Marseille-P6806 TaxID=2364793 RepID=UPI001031C07C|nr:DUF6142 family protein [Lachnoclostridium sp. Marseille-P6806]
MAVLPVRRRKHLFTSKKKSFRALLSDCLGGIALVCSLLVLYLTFRQGGTATVQGGAVFLLCVVFALAGMILAVLSRREPDCYYFFSYLGMLMNGLVLAAGVLVVYLGAV